MRLSPEGMTYCVKTDYHDVLSTAPLLHTMPEFLIKMNTIGWRLTSYNMQCIPPIGRAATHEQFQAFLYDCLEYAHERIEASEPLRNYSYLFMHWFDFGRAGLTSPPKKGHNGLDFGELDFGTESIDFKKAA